MAIDMTEIALREALAKLTDEKQLLLRQLAYATGGMDGEPGSGPGPMGQSPSEYAAVLEIENGELKERVASLKNELAILQQLHGEACQGWSKWQQTAERYQAELGSIYGLTEGGIDLIFSRTQLKGILRLIKRAAERHLPSGFGDIPF